MSAVRIALYQAQSGIDPAANAERLVAAVREAAAGGAAMLFTPEMSGMLDRDRERALAKARARERTTRCWPRSARQPREAGIWVHLGSLALKGEGGQARQPRLRHRRLRARSGRATTRSICSTSTCRPARAGGSRRCMRPGQRAVIVPGTPVGKLGLTICYDLRFPALFERLSEAGADVIAVPAAFTVPTGKAHWQVLLRARAIEAELFVVAAAQAGRHEDGRETYGHSLVVDPWGEVLLEMGGEPGLAFRRDRPRPDRRRPVADPGPPASPADRPVAN